MKREPTLHVVKPAAEPAEPFNPAKCEHWKNPKWVYVPANSTDVRKTIAKAKKQLSGK